MPWWWARRRRFWQPKRNYYRRRRRNRFKRRKRRFPRRRRRRTFTRRRYRRHQYKVRRKKKKIPIQQWQPDRIVKCKIKGYSVLVMGAEGKQMACYTNAKDLWTPPKTPGGGGFGCVQYSLGYLYEEYKFRRNIWTKSNIHSDLCRYLGCKFTVYSHPEVDFILTYDRQPPFDITKATYTSCHPANILLSRHKRILLRKSNNFKAKHKIKLNIKPPKQMISKWFFSEHFDPFALCNIKAAAASFDYPNFPCCDENQLLTIFYLNTLFYQAPNWGQARGTLAYKPYEGVPQKIYTLAYNKPDTTTNWKEYTAQTTYDNSISFDKGWFCPQITTAAYISTQQSMSGHIATTPVNVCRYNPNVDSGKGNKIWLKTIFNNDYNPPQTDMVLIYEGLPLWMMLYGYLNYVTYMKKDKYFLDTYLIVLQSPALKPSSQIGASNMVVPLDNTFVQGKPAYGDYITLKEKGRWYPCIQYQLKTLNNIVKCGPFIPKLQNQLKSTWELDCTYCFYFKFGGPQIVEPAVADPAGQETYPVPDTYTSTIQIKNPAKQTAKSFLEAWDFRRGIVKQSALKRMYENLQTDSSLQSDTSETPKKKKKTGPHLTDPNQENQEIQSCLQELFEKDIYQETQEIQTMEQLIKQQREQQNQLRYNLLKLLSDLKSKQQALQLHTGIHL
nr:MAG: ORF1 [Torque teno midi virus]